MRNNQTILDYWQRALQQQALAEITASKLKDCWSVISNEELSNGTLLDQSLIKQLLSYGPNMVVIPHYARCDDSFFIPYVLSVNIDESGKFLADTINPFPIIPKAVLEPASLCPISLGTDERFENYMLLQPPAWQEDASLLDWPAQLAYAQNLLTAVTEDSWQKELSAFEFYLQDSALIVPLAMLLKPITMDLKLLKDAKKIELIETERNSGKSSYAKGLIIDAWIDAAVKQSPPPRYVWFGGKTKQRLFASIFDFIQLIEDSDHNTSLQEAKDRMHKIVVHYFNLYIKGKQVARNWQEMLNKVDDKYADKGGVHARIAQLQAHLKDAHVRNRHLQVLHSIWLRQSEMVPAWSKGFDLIPLFKKQRLQRLYTFFKQNFPGEDVDGLSQKQLDDIISDKLRRAANSERFIADSLHQTENDLRQEELVRDKCLQWAIPLNENASSLNAILAMLDNELWPKLAQATATYWDLDFKLANGHDNFLYNEANDIDLLILEHAEYISPMHGAELLALSKRAVIMGNNNYICIPRFPVQVDFNLAKSLNLVTCDEDYEDLQFDGIAAAVGNFWSMALQDKEISKTFPSQRTVKLHYEFIQVSSQSESYFGSRINKAEANAILKWIADNQAASDNLAIYASFSGQIELITKLLQKGGYSHIPVLAVQEPCYDKYTVSLFSPVYSSNDPTPYSFDRGMEIINNLIDNTMQQIIVFGDPKIFKAEQHSASGKFAKLLFNNPENEVVSV
jgi:hypothetical protein